jgi:hypothetical protein
MSVLVRIKLTNIGPSITGPFSLYCVAFGVPETPPIVPSITLQQLTSPTGYQILLPTGCNTIRLVSNGVDCTNYIEWEVVPVSTTSTTTTSSSTTTTTLAPCRCHEVAVTGTVTLTYTGCDNIIKNEPYTDVTVNICARRGTVTKSGTGSIVVTPSTTVCAEPIDCWPEFVMDAENLPNLKLQIISTGTYAIEWEPGVYNIYGSGFGIRTYTYSSSYNGLVKIKAPSLSFITRLIITQNYLPTTSGTHLHIYGSEISKLIKLNELDIGYGCNARVFANTSDFPSTLTKLRVYKGTVSGDINNLSSNILTDLQFYGNTDVSGSIQNLPPILQNLAIYGVNTLNGSLADLPPTLAGTLKYFHILGNNQVSGDIGSLGTYTLLYDVRLQGLNTITGDISGISTLVNMKSFSIYGKNRLLGNLSSIAGWTVLSTFAVDNDSAVLVPGVVGNEITGDIANIPNSVKVFVLGKYNTVFGDISTLPTGLISFEIRQNLGGGGIITGNLSSLTSLPLTNFILIGGSHTVTGNINSLPSTLKYFTIYSNNVISGNLKDLPALLSSCSIYSNNALSIITYTSGIKTWPANMSTLDMYIPSSPDITDIDDLVIELAGSTWTSITIPSTWGLRLKGTLTNPAAITAAANIALTPTNVTFY